ncbi:FAST kinase domain-containing protein 1, mitochondrial isoform X2 [Rhincodon typus]|uniref:FAST kinase domain-containing protein 1, mitochondrial isoform X2 n=1 Tax=Rhincodon typus TaxID=259920 RepID=UPI00202E5494|nr:FAST kinase domain-containing protein 1, mitochondrial isoform X2 [Rhincodon typus]
MLLIKMLRLKRTCCPLMNFCRPQAMGCDSLLDQLGNCANEDQIFDVVAKNKAKLSVEHVKHAIHLLWQFQKERPQMLRTIDIVRKHPQFMVLHAVAENKIDLMDDDTLVDMLYNALRLNVEPHDSIIQQFMVEASRRIERFNMATLSKFAVCLTDQHMYHSPLMGEITDIVHRKLEYIQDARILSSLMLSISGMISTHLRNCLIEKAEFLLDTRDPSQLNNSRRIVQFLRNIKFSYRPLLEKCNKIFLQNIKILDADNISIILGVYQSLHFNNCDFRLAAKWRLTELVNAHSDPASFLRLFAALGPLSGPVVRERLESATLLMVDDFSPSQTLAVIETMEEMECRNPQLIQKVATTLYTQLDQFKPVDIARITKALLSLRCQNPELYAKLRQMLISYLHRSVIPYEVSMLTRVLSLLPSPRIDNLISARIDAVLPQCNLSDLNALAIAITKWVRNGSLYQPGIAAVYMKLLQKLNKCGLERLQKADCMDLLMEELKYISGEWFEEVLAEETMTTFERLIDQIHYSAIYATLLPFTILNYDPPQAEEFFESSIQHIRPHLNLCDPHLLVLFGYSLALAGYFPDILIKTIFSVDFLVKLDSQLDTLPDVLNMRIRLRLMELNRAVCLECPEFQTPWFHDRYCQQLLNKGNPSVSAIQQQIQEILEHILGGSIYSKTSVFTPYYYLIDFECILDKHQKPLPYVDQSVKLLSEKGKLCWEPDSKQLVPGAQRVAIDFLDSKAFCKNSPHMKGETVMKKRHLEILGYHVVQIPHFQWNSMELSTKDAWVEYLKQKIFTKES